MIPPYPTELSLEAVRDLVAAVRGQEQPTNHLIHCAVHVANFAIGQVFPCDHPGPYGAALDPNATTLTVEEVCGHLERCCDPPEGFAAVEIPWDLILPVLFEILRRWLERR